MSKDGSAEGDSLFLSPGLPKNMNLHIGSSANKSRLEEIEEEKDGRKKSKKGSKSPKLRKKTN